MNCVRTVKYPRFQWEAIELFLTCNLSWNHCKSTGVSDVSLVLDTVYQNPAVPQRDEQIKSGFVNKPHSSSGIIITIKYHHCGQQGCQVTFKTGWSLSEVYVAQVLTELGQNVKLLASYIIQQWEHHWTLSVLLKCTIFRIVWVNLSSVASRDNRYLFPRSQILLLLRHRVLFLAFGEMSLQF